MFPVAANELGIWLLSGPEPWAGTDAVPSDSTPWWDMEQLLRDHGIRPTDADYLENAQATAVLLHQTSTRWTTTGQVNTFIAVMPEGELLPGARPISLPAVTLMGRPPTHASTEQPATISAAGVLLHALRHLLLLDLLDATASRDMPALLLRHLQALKPALAGLYSETHQQAA